MRRIVITLSVAAVLIAVTGRASAEQLISNGTFGIYGAPVELPWTAVGNGGNSQYYYDWSYNPGNIEYYDDNLGTHESVAMIYYGAYYDMRNEFYYFFYSQLLPPNGEQVNFQDITSPLSAAITTGKRRLTLSADLRAWTGGGPETATAQVRLYVLNASDLTGLSADIGYGWRYYTANTIQFTSSSASDILSWHHNSLTFNIPAGLTFETAGVALWNIFTGPNGVSFDNVSLVSSRPPPNGTVIAIR